MLANTKFTSQPGYIGRLYGPSLPGNLQYCLRFYYAIYGFLKMSDTLAVYIFEENHVVQEKIWSVLESPRGVWMQAEIAFKKPMAAKVQEPAPPFVHLPLPDCISEILFNYFQLATCYFPSVPADSPHPHAVPSQAQLYPSVLSSCLRLRIMDT